MYDPNTEIAANIFCIPFLPKNQLPVVFSLMISLHLFSNFFAVFILVPIFFFLETE